MSKKAVQSEQAAVHASEVQRAEELVQKAEEAGERAIIAAVHASEVQRAEEPVSRRGRRESNKRLCMQARYSEQKSLYRKQKRQESEQKSRYRKQKRQESEQVAVHASEVQ